MKSKCQWAMLITPLVLTASALSLIAWPLAAAKAEPGCPALYAGGVIAFNGLNPALEGKPPLSNFKTGEVVEIDAGQGSQSEIRNYIAALQKKGARVSVYLVGGHCYIGADCDRLKRAGVRVGTTGSWNWDKEERRILDIAHPAVIERLRAEAELGWRLGANYVRIDNLHYPAGSKKPRDAKQLEIIFETIHALEDQLRDAGAIAKDRPTGVVAHNNLEVWEDLIKSGQLARPPVFLTSERTAQLAYKGQQYKGDALMKAGRLKPGDVAEILAGTRIAAALTIPYTIAEFEVSHDLGNRPGTTYRLPRTYVQSLRKMPGVSEVIVIPHESQYVGRGRAHKGPGPQVLARRPHPAGAGRIAQVCMGG